MRLRSLQESVHPLLAMFGAGLFVSMFAVMLAETFSGPTRAALAVRIVVVIGVIAGMLCWVVGARPKKAASHSST